MKDLGIYVVTFDRPGLRMNIHPSKESLRSPPTPLTQSGRVQIELLLRSNICNEGRLPKSLGKFSLERLQFLRLNITKLCGR